MIRLPVGSLVLNFPLFYQVSQGWQELGKHVNGLVIVMTWTRGEEREIPKEGLVR